MSDTQHLNHCLRELGARQAIQGLQLDRHGAAGLRLRDGRACYLQLMPQLGKIYLYAPVAPLAGNAYAEQLGKLLRSHCLGQWTAGGTLSISHMLMAIVYHRSLALSQLQTTTLEQCLETFLQQLRPIQHLLAAHSPTGARHG